MDEQQSLELRVSRFPGAQPRLVACNLRWEAGVLRGDVEAIVEAHGYQLDGAGRDDGLIVSRRSAGWRGTRRPRRLTDS